MSLVTRCTACDTNFKVVRDQLRISDGWVRCGRCSHVFDASVDLREIDEAPITPAQTQVEPEAPRPCVSEFDPPAGVADVLDDVAPQQAPLSKPPPEAIQEPLSDSVVADDASLNFSPDTMARYQSISEIVPSLEIGPIGQAPLQQAGRRALVVSVDAARGRGEEEGSEAAAAEQTGPAPTIQTASENDAAVVNAADAPPFLHAAAATPAFWHRSNVRMVLGVGIVVALMLLGLQVLRRERDAIVARQPSLRPAMSRMCAFTGCKLSAVRQIADITIDGAAFTREKAGEGYRLSFTLRNAATVPLAMPAVELSLLDTQEKVVVRRVLMPAEFNAPAELPARAERAASLPLALTGAEATALPPIAGYRVVAFYP
jgi:predicted Zn finger-like uncharacterized protein